MDISQIRALILFIGTFLELILVLFLWFKGKSRTTFHLGWAALFSAIFCFSYGLIYLPIGNSLLWNRATWSGVLIVPASFAFVYVFTGRIKYFRLKVFILYLIALVIFCLALFTPYFVKSVSLEYPYKDTPGSLATVGRLYVISGGIAVYYLLKEYFKSEGLRKLQIRYFIMGVSLPSIGGFFTAGLIRLIYPELDYSDITAMLTVPGVSLVSYAIFKARLFGIKVILTEILVVIIALFLLTEGLLNTTPINRIFSFIIFILFLLVGYLLIRTTQEEVRRKIQAEKLAQELKDLNKTLEQRVNQRTKELRQSYDQIKKRTEELEKFYNLTVGRELKMLELKKQLRDLKKSKETE